jgi:hypothetical protein
MLWWSFLPITAAAAFVVVFYLIYKIYIEKHKLSEGLFMTVAGMQTLAHITEDQSDECNSKA